MVSAVVPRKVLFTHHFPYAIDGFRKLVGSAASSQFKIVTEPTVEGCFTRKDLLKNVQGVSAIYCLVADSIDKEVLDAAGPSLKVVSTMSVGFNHIDWETCKERNIHVGHTPYVLDQSTAETAVALTFVAKRRLVECADVSRKGEWGTWKVFDYCGSDVSDNTVGVVGLGRIGMAYARMMKYGFNCKILYSGPREKPEHVAALGGDVEYVDLPTLLQRSDIVSIHSPLNESTRNSINADSFKLMKPDSVLVNTSRGGVVDQDALIHALETKQIAAAALDVTTPEPLDPSHKLFTLPNCVIFPHIGSATIATRKLMMDTALKNMYAGLHGQPLAHSVY